MRRGNDSAREAVHNRADGAVRERTMPEFVIYVQVIERPRRARQTRRARLLRWLRRLFRAA